MLRWIVAAALVLSACATPAERAARMETEMERMIQEYGPACERLGYKRDDDKWRECILRLSSQIEQRYYRMQPLTTCMGHYGFYNYCY